MPELKQVKVGFTRTIQPQQYESEGANIELVFVARDGEEVGDDYARTALAHAKQEVYIILGLGVASADDVPQPGGKKVTRSTRKKPEAAPLLVETSPAEPVLSEAPMAVATGFAVPATTPVAVPAAPDLSALGFDIPAATPAPAASGVTPATAQQVNILVGDMARTYGDDVVQAIGAWLRSAEQSGVCKPGSKMYDLDDNQRGLIVQYLQDWAAARKTA